MSINMFVEYSKRHNCTVAQAIADRDEPANAGTLTHWFFEATGRAPTREEMDTMRPDSAATIQEQINYYRE